MGEAGTAPRVLPLLALFSPDRELLRAEGERWLAAHGGLCARFGPYPFTVSTYYHDELGGEPLKEILVGAQPCAADFLAAAKRASNARERELAADGRRRLNLDPGWLDGEQLVLATTKRAGHRLYLRDGIYAEVTLQHHHGAWQAARWTYPDFRDDAVRAWLQALRGQVRARLADA